jgi:hypothetical protein
MWLDHSLKKPNLRLLPFSYLFDLHTEGVTKNRIKKKVVNQPNPDYLEISQPAAGTLKKEGI